MPARFRERREDFPGYLAEQIVKRGEGQRSFRWHRLARQHPRGLARHLQRMPPDGGLADPGIARDNKRRRPPGVSRKERQNLADLNIPPN